MTQKLQSLELLLQLRLRLALAGEGSVEKNEKENFDSAEKSAQSLRLNLPQKLRRELISTPEFLSENPKTRNSYLLKNYGDEQGLKIIQALENVSTEKIANTINWANEDKNHLLFINDDNYPARLKQLSDAPILIYAKGNLELLNTPALAIVGSRSASKYGENLANDFANQLSANGITIVSGLALGIDQAAHQGAMDNGSSATIGVLGTGANIIYPKKSTKLAREMANKALILSEFSLDTSPRPFNFPKRNRIIAALSLGCLVVEASDNSGALITARMAGELGIEVFAIPGSVHSPLSRGPHRLIREGAKLVESTKDILEELHSQLIPFVRNSEQSQNINNLNILTDVNNTNNNQINVAQTSSLLTTIPYTPTLLDDIIAEAKIPITEIHSQLLTLEMQGMVESLPGGRFQRIK